MATALTVVKAKEAKPRPKRERIALIEARPKEEWFVRSVTVRGRVVWFIRFELTGLHPRLYGPFSSKRQGLLFLDAVIGELQDKMYEVDYACETRMVKEECQQIWPPIIEYPLLTQRHSATTKGR